jgi:Serine dehydrogenase proteinase
MAGFGIVNLVREFYKKLSVLIPFRAHSAATLIALGADEIVMTRLGQLSPVDLSVTSPLNPSVPGPQNSPNLVPVSVEDGVGYLDLARKEAKYEESPFSLLELLPVAAPFSEKEIEDRLDAEEAKRRLADPNEVPIPYEQVRKELGLA